MDPRPVVYQASVVLEFILCLSPGQIAAISKPNTTESLLKGSKYEPSCSDGCGIVVVLTWYCGGVDLTAYVVNPVDVAPS